MKFQKLNFIQERLGLSSETRSLASFGPRNHPGLMCLLAAVLMASNVLPASAQTPRQCDDLRTHGANLKRASDALNNSMGADASKRVPAAVEAAIASAEALYAFDKLREAASGGATTALMAEVSCRLANNPDDLTSRSICLLDNFEEKHRRAVDKLEALLRIGPPTQVQRAAQDVLNALRSASSGGSACVEALKRAQNAPPATGGIVGPQIQSSATIGAPPPNSFDADVLGFHVKLENGSVERSGSSTRIRGTVSVWPKNNPSLKLTLRDAAVTVQSGGAGFTSVGGVGRLEVSVSGQTIAFTDASFDSTPDGNTLNGSGKMQRYGHTFEIAYSITAQNFTGQGEWRGRSKGWQSVPGAEIEYQISDPLVRVSVNGATASATFDADKIEVRTKARNSNGDPWAKAEVNPDPVTISVDGRLQIPMPTLPQPSDPNKIARETCEAAARKLMQDPKPCGSQFPPPPGLPNLPSRVEVTITVVIE